MYQFTLDASEHSASTSHSQVLHLLRRRSNYLSSLQGREITGVGQPSIHAHQECIQIEFAMQAGRQPTSTSSSSAMYSRQSSSPISMGSACPELWSLPALRCRNIQPTTQPLLATSACLHHLVTGPRCDGNSLEKGGRIISNGFVTARI